jgi:uncharacterized membrane protein
MNDHEANKVVHVILIFIILGILFILSILAKTFIWNNMLDKLHNNSGNYNAIKIILMFAAGIAIYFLIYWLLTSRSFKYNSLKRGEEEKRRRG